VPDSWFQEAQGGPLPGGPIPVVASFSFFDAILLNAHHIIIMMRWGPPMRTTEKQLGTRIENGLRVSDVREDNPIITLEPTQHLIDKL
jgi:hypothetical protein